MSLELQDTPADPAEYLPEVPVADNGTELVPDAKGVFDPVKGVMVDKDGIPIPGKRRSRPLFTRPEDLKIDTRSVFDKDPAMLGPVAERDADGFVTGTAGLKKLDVSPRKVYRRHTFFRVAAENVRIEAMCAYGTDTAGKTIWSGWSRVLPVGTIVECIGWRRFRRDGTVAPQFQYDGLPAEARYSQVWPLDSIWRPWPLVGILEKLRPDEVEELGLNR